MINRKSADFCDSCIYHCAYGGMQVDRLSKNGEGYNQGIAPTVIGTLLPGVRFPPATYRVDGNFVMPCQVDRSAAP
mgnify:CR=1 FL=1|jgi:hypothetical protein